MGQMVFVPKPSGPAWLPSRINIAGQWQTNTAQRRVGPWTVDAGYPGTNYDSADQWLIATGSKTAATMTIAVSTATNYFSVTYWAIYQNGSLVGQWNDGGSAGNHNNNLTLNVANGDKFEFDADCGGGFANVNVITGAWILLA